MRWLRRPWVHFVALGAMLFALDLYTTADRPPARPTITITAARLAEMRMDAARHGVTVVDEDAIVDRAIEEEILLQEAIALGLDRDEQSIEWRLAQKMRFLGTGDGCAEDETSATDRETLFHQAQDIDLGREDPIVRGILVHKMRFLLKRAPNEAPPSDEELRTYLKRERKRYILPVRSSFWHVFLSRDRRGAAVAADARRLLDRLTAGTTTPVNAVRLGDPFQLGSHLKLQTVQDLTRIFGADFAANVMGLEGKRWVGPIASPFGLHLVWVEEQQPARLPALASVRAQLTAQYLEEQRQARLDEAIRELRGRYLVRIEQGAEERG